MYQYGPLSACLTVGNAVQRFTRLETFVNAATHTTTVLRVVCVRRFDTQRKASPVGHVGSTEGALLSHLLRNQRSVEFKVVHSLPHVGIQVGPFDDRPRRIHLPPQIERFVAANRRRTSRKANAK